MDEPNVIEIPKGQNGKFKITTWKNDKTGDTLVSVGVWFIPRGEGQEYVPTKKSFTIDADKADQLADALKQMAAEAREANKGKK